MSDRVARSVLEFSTKGDDAVVAAYDKIGAKAKDASGAVGGLGGQFGGLGTAIKGFLGLAVVAKVAQFTSGVVEAAGAVQDLSNRLGVSTGFVQELQHVADQTGSSVETFTAAAFRLGVTVATGTEKARSAVKDLGLSYDTLKNQRPEDQFRAVIQALEGVEDVQERNRLGVALFGKTFAEIAPAVAEGYSDMAASASKMSDETIQALDRLGDYAGKVGSQVAAAVGTVVAGITQGVEDTIATATLQIDKYTSAQKILIRQRLAEGGEGMALLLRQIEEGNKKIAAANSQQGTGKPAADYAAALDEIDAKLKALKPNQVAQLTAAIALGNEAAKEYAETLGIGAEGLDRFKERAAKAKVEADRLSKSVADRQRDERNYYNWKGEREIAAAEAAQAAADRTLAAWRAFHNELGVLRMEEDRQRLEALKRFEESAATTMKTLLAAKATWTGTGLGMLRGTVPENRPGDTGGSGFKWGSALGPGLNLLGGMIPGQNQLGSGIGSAIGLGIGSMKKFAESAFGAALGPLGGILGGLAGNLLGKLFGGEAKKTRDTRNQWIESVGGMEQLKATAAAAGVSLDRLFAAKKVKDFEAEQKKVLAAIEKHKALVEEMNALEEERARLVAETTVSYDQMQDVAERFGINQEGLGQAFQQKRLGTDAQSLIDAIEVMRRGGADMGTVLFGMRDEIAKLVLDSAKFGTEIPENLRPFIEHLLETGNLLDENGEVMKELPSIKFGEAMASQLEKASDKLAEVVDRLADVLSQLDSLNGRQVNFSVNGSYNGAPAPDGGGTPWSDGANAASAAVSSVVSASSSAFSTAGVSRALQAARDGASSTPLSIVMDGQVAARAVIRRAGRTLSLVGA